MTPYRSSTNAAPKETTGRKSKVEKAWTFQKYRNGKLNLKAPARFMHITKNNSTQSPLLRIPPEIRNKIFGYAMGGYDIYIAAFNNRMTIASRTLNDGKVKRYQIYHDYKLVTTILPHSEDYRPAAPGDDLPNFTLSRVCRQLYGETALLPYTLNHFKFVNVTRALGKTEGKYAGHDKYNALDFWVERRLPAQLKALVSIAPIDHYIYLYYDGKRPAFLKRFPSLRTLDLRSMCLFSGDNNNTQWYRSAQNKDLESDLRIIWRTHHYSALLDHDYGRLGILMKTHPTHFAVIVGAKSAEEDGYPR